MEKIYEKYQGKLPLKIMDEVRTNVPDSVTDKQLTEILEKCVFDYESSQVEAGESVGIISAESIGEQGTQMTLNTFHFAGVAEMSVTTGLPRIIEIADGRKTLSTPSMEIHLLEPYKSGKGIREYAASIKESTLTDYAKNFIINIAEGLVEVELASDKLKLAGLDVDKLLALTKKGFKTHTSKIIDGKIVVKAKSKENDIVGVYKLKDKLEAMYVSGIKGITQVLPVKRDDEFVVVTAGTNLKDVLKYEGVDIFNTVTNDFYEIEKLFGIEAARQSIINEMKQVVESQGLDVDIRHIMLVADIMTVGGTVKGVTRYGVVSEKSSVLARASFETPIKHLINAALVGEDDKLTSIVENVMLNQPIPVGTGLPGLKMKP